MRWARLLMVLAAAVGLGYLVTLYGLTASALAAGDTRTALALRPNSEEALSLAAEQALARSDLPRAEALARAALVRMPRSVRALRVMGVATSLRGRPELGSELLLRSGTLSWRDETTQLWLIRAAIDQHNFPTAMQRLDAMLRGGLHTLEMLRLAHELAAFPEARAALIDRLAEGPSWRGAFLVDMEAIPKGAETSQVLLIDELRAREGPLQREELAPFVRYLVDQGGGKLARHLWLGNLTAEERTMAGGIYDGDFREDPTAESAQPRYVFEWSLENGGGAMASIGTPPLLIGETALNVRSGDTEQRLASQTILLGPGMHQLTYSVTPADDGAAQDFKWRVLCVGHNRDLPLGAPGARNVGSWRTIVQSFEVPQDCAAQRIELVALAGNGSGGELWFDHISVQ
jgi:hypothetical protein